MAGFIAGCYLLTSVDSSLGICGQLKIVRSIASYGRRGLGREKHVPKAGNHQDGRPAGVARSMFFRERALKVGRRLESWVGNSWYWNALKERLQVVTRHLELEGDSNLGFYGVVMIRNQRLYQKRKAWVCYPRPGGRQARKMIWIL